MVLSDKITLSEYRRIYENRKNSILTPHTLNHNIHNGSSIILLIIFEEFYSRVKYFKLFMRIQSTIICFALTSDKKNAEIGIEILALEFRDTGLSSLQDTLPLREIYPAFRCYRTVFEPFHFHQKARCQTYRTLSAVL